jgi:hypothetical protein
VFKLLGLLIRGQVTPILYPKRYFDLGMNFLPWLLQSLPPEAASKHCMPPYYLLPSSPQSVDIKLFTQVADYLLDVYIQAPGVKVMEQRALLHGRERKYFLNLALSIFIEKGFYR